MKEQPLDQLRDLAGRLKADPGTKPLGLELGRLASALAEHCDQIEQERGRTSDQLALAGRLVELGTMAAAVFHEMNQPLLGIKGFAELIHENLGKAPPDKIAAWAQEIRNQVARVQLLQQQVSTFLRPEQSTDHQPVELAAAIQEALGLFQGRLAKKKIQLDLSLADGLPPLAVNRQHLVQILVNLVGNALDAMEPVQERSLRITALPVDNGRRVRILVTDSGTGVDPQIRDKLFEPFFTTKTGQGSGLGLYVCERLAAHSGGELSLADPASLGWKKPPATAIDLRLPTFQTAIPDQPMPAAGQADSPNPGAQASCVGDDLAPDGGPLRDHLAQLEQELREYNRALTVSQRILVADDDQAAQKELTETLAQHGLLADLTTSGEEALARVAEREYAVLLAGLKLPDMDGIELMRSAHKLRPALEAIISTRSSSLDEVIRAFDRGASDYLPKPYPSRPFISWKVRGALARHDFEVRAQAFIQFLKKSCEELASGQGHDLHQRCVVPLKQALESYQQELAPVKIAISAPVGLTRAARNLGYEATQAKGLTELLELVRNGQAQVVVAVEETGGLDGVELITRVWRIDPDTGIFIVAPEKKLQPLVQAFGTGVGDSLLRPLEGRELFAPRLGRLVVRQQRVMRYKRLLSALKSLNLDLKAPAPRKS